LHESEQEAGVCQRIAAHSPFPLAHSADWSPVSGKSYGPEPQPNIRSIRSGYMQINPSYANNIIIFGKRMIP